VLAAQPDNLEARARVAEALWRLGEFEGAAREYRAWADRAPDDPRAWYGLGKSYEGFDRVSFARLERLAPDSEYLTLLVAQTMAEEGRQAEAFRLYREALERRPDQPDVREQVARIYEETGHPEWAALERQRARAGPAPKCALASGECAFRGGQYATVLEGRSDGLEGLYWKMRSARELAAQAFARLQQLPPSPEATLQKVERLRTRKRTLAAEVVAALKVAAQAWPDDLRIRRELATVLFLTGETEAARPILEDLLAREPDSTELALLLGETWLKALQPAKAVPLLERAAARDPDLLPVQAALGRAYLEAGEPAKAVAPLERALPTDKDGSLHYQLARAYRATGQAPRAAEATARFQELRKAAEAEAAGLREEFQITPP
jgi:predicted Zn-dependent protease